MSNVSCDQPWQIHLCSGHADNFILLTLNHCSHITPQTEPGTNIQSLFPARGFPPIPSQPPVLSRMHILVPVKFTEYITDTQLKRVHIYMTHHQKANNIDQTNMPPYKHSNPR